MRYSDLARRHPFSYVYTTDSLAVVASRLAQREVHRVPVVDKATGEMVALITQSALVQWVVDNKALLGRSIRSTTTLAPFNCPRRARRCVAPSPQGYRPAWDVSCCIRMRNVARA